MVLKIFMFKKAIFFLKDFFQRKPKLAILLFFLLITLAISFSFLTNIIAENFTVRAHYSLLSSFSRNLNIPGASALWISSYVSGFPAYLGQGSSLLNPLIFLFFYLFDFIAAYNLLLFLSFLLSVIFSFLMIFFFRWFLFFSCVF